MTRLRSCTGRDSASYRPRLDSASSTSPFTPGVFAGDYLYVSGQGATAPDGQMASTFDAQVRQALENVKSVVEAAGLTLRNVVYTQVYLDDMAHYDAMNRVYAKYFRDTPPARATVGVAGLPGGTPVEINAVAVRDARKSKPSPQVNVAWMNLFQREFSPKIACSSPLCPDGRRLPKEKSKTHWME